MNMTDDILSALASISNKDTALLKQDKDLNLFHSGYFDSLTVVQFIVAIEKKFKIRISKSDIKYSSFETLSSIEELIAEKLK